MPDEGRVPPAVPGGSRGVEEGSRRGAVVLQAATVAAPQAMAATVRGYLQSRQFS